jgi:VRR-NUC domain
MSLHWTEDEYQAHLRRGLEHEGLYLGSRAYSPLVSEKAFQAAVVRVAKEAGYLCWHAYSAKKSAAGYPDLTLAKAGVPLILAELKTDTGELTRAQEAWLAALAGSTGVVAATWRPSMWEEICRELRG